MKKNVYKSLALHVIILIFLLSDFASLWRKKPDPTQVPIIVDLSQLKISKMTNLPPKAKKANKDEEASKVKRKVETTKKKEAPKPKKQPEPKKEAPKKSEPKKEDSKLVETPKVKPKKEAPKPKPKVKKVEPKVEPKKEEAKLANPLKSLLASVDALEKETGNKSGVAKIKDISKLNNMGIEGGSKGSYFSDRKSVV